MVRIVRPIEPHPTMSEPKGRPAERNAGVFLGPDLLAPVPTHTLSDEYHDRPVDPPDDRVPPPKPPGMLRRAIERSRRRRDTHRQG
jgi:hypothetical protein